MRMIVIKSLDSPSNSASYINFGEDVYVSVIFSVSRRRRGVPAMHAETPALL